MPSMSGLRVAGWCFGETGTNHDSFPFISHGRMGIRGYRVSVEQGHIMVVVFKHREGFFFPDEMECFDALALSESLHISRSEGSIPVPLA